ncbi:DUF2236 domain-containing protein [Egibacter rhizosphaerae]|uniref:DUF2236 domain-containing protein n=1 Tax=Egibacter rhizosphaerae TaxID=1670831 RepID=A0A411YJJ0_9ACTN|nr:oxygenase MpaB family protein [Egibacter rhizosphaerae]QBI21331.1 DUF2236 domain-containing protein [Egibacter rhizosphaerae]
MPTPFRRLAGLSPHGLPLARTLVRSGLARVFGAPPFDVTADPGDPGLFGPGSASWRIIAEPAAIAGGVRALLVQLLHPHAMAGVADHSAFRTDPLGRLHRTSAYITVTTFGSTREALDTARVIRRVHTTVRGTAPDGRSYAAEEPRLLGWVSLALTSSMLATDAVFAPRPAEPDVVDRFVAEQARAASLLDARVDLERLAADPEALTALRTGRLELPLVREGWVPTTGAELDARLAAYRPELTITEQGREAFRFLRWPPLPPTLRAAYLPLLAGALATLAPAQRALLDLPSGRLATAPATAQTRALLGALRLTVGTSPARDAAARRAASDPAGTDHALGA